MCQAKNWLGLDAKGTFFVTGSELLENIDDGRAIIEAVHKLGNHSFSHNHTDLLIEFPGARMHLARQKKYKPFGISPGSSFVRMDLAVFDMVGTTVHAGDEVPSSFREAFRRVGIALSEEEISRIRGRSKIDAISTLLSRKLEAPVRVGEQVETVYAHFQETLRAAYRAGARAIPGAEDAIRFLRQAEIEVVLTTGLDRKTAQTLVEGLGWDSLGLCGVVTGDDVRRGRPAPDLIHSAMALAGVEDPRLVVAIGDTCSDLEAAAAAKVGWSIGVLSGAHSRSQLEEYPHSAILESVRTLPRWLVGVGAL